MSRPSGDNTWDEIRKKLAELHPERLAEELVQIARRAPEAADRVARLIANPEQNVLRFRSKLRRLQKSDRFVSWRETSDYAQQLRGLLADLRTAAPEPGNGIELVAEFFRTDAAIFDRCDDSNGSVGDVFRMEASDLFGEFAEGCEDKSKVVELMLRLLGDDEYGVRDSILENASSYLPETEMRRLASRMLKQADGHPTFSYEARRWLGLVECVARQLADPEMFEEARLASWEDPPATAYLDMAEVRLKSGDALRALQWLEQMPSEGNWRIHDRDDLLLECYRALGRKDELTETAWRLLRGHRCEKNLKTLLDIIGEERREAVVRGQIREILDRADFVFADLDFLRAVGAAREARDYVLERASHLSGDHWSYLRPLANEFEKSGHLLAASVVYRALLDSILDGKVSKAYLHGAEYLKRLDFAAERIDDWREVPQHEAYKEMLRQNHGRKWKFWKLYEAT